jgi:predicted Zn finger-like uncharacterized protein
VRVVAAYNDILMSQVTRCPSCGTRFKVVADQLRISQGWVRCGMCQSVFDASQDLQSVPDELLQPEAADAPQKPPVQEMQPTRLASGRRLGRSRMPQDSRCSAFDAQKAEAADLADSDSVDAAPGCSGRRSRTGSRACRCGFRTELSGSMPGMADAQPRLSIRRVLWLKRMQRRSARSSSGCEQSEGGLEAGDIPAPAEPALEELLVPPPKRALMPEAAQDLEDEAPRPSQEALLHADIGDIQPARPGASCHG